MRPTAVPSDSVHDIAMRPARAAVASTVVADQQRSALDALDLAQVNASLRDQAPREIVRWAASLQRRAIVTTSMGINAAATLHAVCSEIPEVPVVWVDHGFNVAETYRVAEALTAELRLNLHVANPTMTAARLTARLGGIPRPEDTESHRWFTEQVKLLPFQRALDHWQPEIWFSGIRREETAFRRHLDIVSRDDRGLLRIAPFFYWREQEVTQYVAQHGLPTARHYFDPTKGSDNRECGLHTQSTRLSA